MKAGDKVWVWIRQRYVGTDPDGYRMFDMANPGNPIPDHPALPAVARWLAKWSPRDIEEMTAILHEYGGDDCHYSPTREMECKRELFEVLSLAALTTEETA